MKKLPKIAAILGAGVIAFATTSSAVIINYDFALTPEEEVQDPAVVSSGTGFAEVTLDTETNLLTWDVTFSDLEDNYTNAHFHGSAAPGANAGPFQGIHQPEFTDQTFGNLVGSATLSETNKQIILDGLAYINIHSVEYPGGELRGQVVPEPGTYALFAGLFTLAGVAWFRWRKA